MAFEKNLLISVIGVLLFNPATEAAAQLGGDGPPLPKLVLVDPVGVDLRTGRRTNTDGAISIGADKASVTVSVGASGTSSSIPLWGYVYFNCYPDESGENPCYTLITEFSTDGMSERSDPSQWGGHIEGYDASSDGSLIDINSTHYIYWRKDGVALHFKRIVGNINPYVSNPIRAYLDKIAMPNGVVFTYNYSSPPALNESVPLFDNPDRPVSIKGSNGIEIRLTKPSLGARTVALVNNSHVACGGITGSCDSSTLNWPSLVQSGYPGYGGSAIFPEGATVAYGSSVIEQVLRYKANGAPVYELSNTLTDPTGNVLKYYRMNAGDSVACTYTSFIRKVDTPSGTWTYSYQTMSIWDCGVLSSTSTAPDGSTIQYNPAGLTVVTDQIGRQTKYSFLRDSVTYVKYPEGNEAWFDYDQRMNLVKSTENAKPGSGMPTRIRQWTYLEHCTMASILYCNKPTSYIDAKGNVTNYTYSPDHGGVLTEVRPAVAGVSPAKKYSYTQQYTWLKSSSGGYVQTTTPIWVMTEERHCQTSALSLSAGTCGAGLSDLVVTAYEYQVGNSAKPSNLWLKGMAVTANGQTLRTCYGYDPLGNRISETKPRAGLANCQ